jgi:hypothetical protein
MWEVCPPVFCSVDTKMALDLVEVWRVEQTRSSRGGICRRRRVWIHGRWSLGCVPDRWIFSIGFISSLKASVYCGSSQSHVAMELLLTWGWWIWLLVASGGGQRQRIPEASVCRGLRDLFVIFFCFSRASMQCWWNNCPLYPLTVCVFKRVFVLYPQI